MHCNMPNNESQAENKTAAQSPKMSLIYRIFSELYELAAAIVIILGNILRSFYLILKPRAGAIILKALATAVMAFGMYYMMTQGGNN